MMPCTELSSQIVRLQLWGADVKVLGLVPGILRWCRAKLLRIVEPGLKALEPLEHILGGAVELLHLALELLSELLDVGAKVLELGGKGCANILKRSLPIFNLDQSLFEGHWIVVLDP